jgi:hypothetical protein
MKMEVTRSSATSILRKPTLDTFKKTTFLRDFVICNFLCEIQDVAFYRRDLQVDSCGAGIGFERFIESKSDENFALLGYRRDV